ncbi:DUF3224 domain-containing protein [Actinomycetota bacterium Odt1-20B]
MPRHQTATGTFTFASWDEQPVAGAEGGARIAHAAVVNGFTGGIESAATACEYTIAYTTQKTGAFTGYEFLDGSVDGRAGSFVIEQRGTFAEDGTISCAFTVLPGSGSGALAGLSGSGSFTAREGVPTVPYTFDYELG